MIFPASARQHTLALCELHECGSMKSEKKPLYRKVNTRARGVHHNFGGDYSESRGRESAIGMRKGIRRGLDYTPLFRFLLKNVGNKWDDVYSEAVSRLDKQEPIFWMVSLDKDHTRETIRTGESTYYSGLYVDHDGILKMVNPSIDETTLEPSCRCCTHTYNGKVFTKKYSN